MFLIVMTSPNGGVGKSTCAVLLVSEFARMDAVVTVLDCDPCKSQTAWASHGLTTSSILETDFGRSEIVPTIRSADGDGKIVNVYPEEDASHVVSRANSQSDLVVVPMQFTTFNAESGPEVLVLVDKEDEARGRSLRHVVVLTTASSAVKSYVRKELEGQLSGAGNELILPSLGARAVFSEIFACGGDLTAMMNDPDMTTVGNVENGDQCSIFHGGSL